MKIRIVSKEYDDEEFIGYRDTNPSDDLWFACVEIDGQRCPFPFAVDVYDEGDSVPDWLTEEVKSEARKIARQIGGRMSAYATPETPEVAIEFSAFGRVVA